MGYERNDRRWQGGEGPYGQGRSNYGSDYDRDRGYRGERDRYDDRSFFERAGDEVRSWFGDEEAERRRRYDERYDDRYEAGRERGADRYGARAGWDRDRDQDRFSRGSYGSAAYRPVGADQRSDYSGYRSHAGGQASDHSYTSWRDRQMAELDRDYDEYRRENQSRFESEFATFRTRRQGQRDLLGQVKEHMEVVGSDGQHVGTVDHVRGDRIQLTKSDPDAGGRHHTIPSSWIEGVADNRVTIAKTADAAKRAWHEESESDRGGLFGGRGDNDRGDWSGQRNLNRSFSGTY